MDVHIINRKGGVVLLYNGYQFNKNKTYSNGNEVWLCT